MRKLHLKTRASYMRIPAMVIDSFEIRCLAVTELYCPVRDVPAFAEGVMRSIEVDGLANPVIVVRGPREDLVSQMESVGGSGAHLPDSPVVNCVYGGTNRVTAARELGYTHIDCILLPTFELGMRLQTLQRGSYNGSKAESVGDRTA